MKNDLIMLLPDLRAFSRLLCRERLAADELLHNTVATALATQDEFELGTNLKAWLFAIMRTRFYADFIPSRRGAACLNDFDDDVASVRSRGLRAASMELRAALWRLNPQYREALLLIGAGGFSYEEAAQLCGCAIGTVKARVSRARQQLADTFG